MPETATVDAGSIRRVGVVGLGTMGAGIVEVFARAGIAVVASEINAEAVERGRAVLTGSLDRAVARGRCSIDERAVVLARVEFTVGLAALSGVDVVVEAAPERLDIKHQIFAELDKVCGPDTILATNTSSLPVVRIAAATGRPTRVLGMHFFNPAPVMRLVEVVHTIDTDPAVATTISELCARLGKTAVVVGDRAGFIANALLFGYLNNAATLAESGYATREDIDAAMRVGVGLPMGPLTLMDLIGLDVSVEILDTVYRRGGRDRRYAPAPLLREMVAAGLLGRKTGRGFFTYQAPGSGTVIPDDHPASGVAAARPVHTIGVLGAGARAAELTAALGSAGFTMVPITAVDQPGSVMGGSARSRLAGVDLVIEALDGNRADRLGALADLGRECGPGTILATTMAHPVIEAAMATGRPADVIGLDLPAPPVNARGGLTPVGDDTPLRGRLAQLIHTVHTSPAALATLTAVVESAGMITVRCGDRAGFLMDTLLLPHLNDAARMVEVGYATVADIDTAMTLGCGYPVGPFTLLDERGLDTVLAGQWEIYQALREPGLAPAPLLDQLVAAGHLGARVGQGFSTLTR